MKKILVLIITFMVIMLSCAQDEVIEQTFLERYDGKVLVSTPQPNTYIVLNNDIDNLVTLITRRSIPNTPFCYYISSVNDPGWIDLVKVSDTVDKLVITVMFSGNENITWSFYEEGDKIAFATNLTDLNGEDVGKVLYTLTALTLDDFNKCE